MGVATTRGTPWRRSTDAASSSTSGSSRAMTPARRGTKLKPKKQTENCAEEGDEKKKKRTDDGRAARLVDEFQGAQVRRGGRGARVHHLDVDGQRRRSRRLIVDHLRSSTDISFGPKSLSSAGRVLETRRVVVEWQTLERETESMSYLTL